MLVTTRALPVSLRPVLVSRQLVPAMVSLSDVLTAPATLAPLNTATEGWLREVVWLDFRLAVLLFVLTPLVLLGWRAVGCRPGALRDTLSDAVLRVITGYWQASSLLLITVLLNIEASPLGVAAGLAAQGMILVSLWWWKDLGDDVADAAPSALRSVFTVWRGLASVAAAGGVVLQIPGQTCLAVDDLVASPSCAAWLEPPFAAATLAGLPPPPLGLGEEFSVAELALGVDLIYLCYYLAVVLPETGRCGRAPRSCFTWIDPLRQLGFLGEQELG